MAHAEIVKDLVKPPFANYDIVVYFGCGIFFLPFLFHYIGEDKLQVLNFQFAPEPSFTAILVSSLTILFGVYILGHMIAYAGSQFVQRLMDSLFGKTSTVILLGSRDHGGSNAMFRKQLKKKTKLTWKRAKGVLIFRLFFHLPVLIPYLALYLCGAFGFYRTRLAEQVLVEADKEFANIKLPGGPVSEDYPWYKAMEAYVMNHCPIATARMYNYLVIFGVFRSLCIIFLFALWFEFFGLIQLLSCRKPSVSSLFALGQSGALGQLLSYSVLLMLYVFSLFSYLKFQRRYAEDAIFAFVLSKP